MNYLTAIAEYVDFFVPYLRVFTRLLSKSLLQVSGGLKLYLLIFSGHYYVNATFHDFLNFNNCFL